MPVRQAEAITSEQAALALNLPALLGEYRNFRDGFHEMALEAWNR